MEGPEGIQLDAAIGTTDRGSLWRATRQNEHDRIVRIVEPRFCDGRFRQALTNLCQRPYPRMLEITGEGWSGAHFSIEYAVDPPWQTLEARLDELAHWRDRLLLLNQVCEVLPLWHHSPVRPLGLSLRNIVVMRDAGRWFPWLLPCPAITICSPCDLFGLDSAVVAALAPEQIRGVQLDQHAQDAYALGTLVAQAIGCPESRLATNDDENRIEAQARGALLVSAATRSEIPPFLCTTPQVTQLFQAIRHYRHTAPDARPHNANELQAAVTAVTDLLALAGALRSTDSGQALDVLSWVSKSDAPQYLSSLCLAAEISAEAGDARQSLHYLDRAVSFAPDRLDLRRQRCDARWQVFKALPREEPADQEGELLLKELTLLRNLGLITGTMPYLRAAEVHRRRGDLPAAANELYEATTLDPCDFRALFLYAQCWIELGDPGKAATVANTARHRINTWTELDMLTTTEAQRWRQDFAIFPH